MQNKHSKECYMSSGILLIEQYQISKIASTVQELLIAGAL